MLICAAPPPGARSAAPADLRFAAYGGLLGRVVHDTGVDYRAILGDRTALDRIVAEFAEVPAATEKGWEARDRMAFWINAYNLFTLRAIVDHYPIRGSWFSRAPRNSIRQIDGVWTTLKWRAAGRDVTLDQIEHGILRPEFGDARVHMAVNCASKSCPPLRGEPYLAADLDRQLDDAARRLPGERCRHARRRQATARLQDFRLVRRRLREAVRRAASWPGTRERSRDPRLRRTVRSAARGGRRTGGRGDSVSRLRLVAQRRAVRRRRRSALKPSAAS